VIFYETNFNAAIKLLLCHSLVRSVRYSAFVNHHNYSANILTIKYTNETK